MTVPLALGSLCTGYGGLDLAAEELLGARTIWCAEFEEAPSRVIAARFPGVPNVHDVKRIPWHIMAPIDALTAGYPCQPFSLAGARKGEDDPRHLWPSIAEGIRIMRPRHVLLENVRGHLSLGFDQVLHDLNAFGYAVAWRILSAAAVGACHRRERLFIYAQPVEFVAEQRGPVLAVAGAEGWLDAEADLFGERMRWTEQLPPAGTMYAGEIRALRMHQPVVARAVFPTPRASDGAHGGPNQRGSRGDLTMSSAVALLPTPDASIANDGEGPETWLARRERVKSKGINGNGMGMPLTIAVQLLPTPEAKLALSGPDFARADRPASGGADLATVAVLFPTPQASDAVFSATARTGGRPLEKSTKLGTQVALLSEGPAKWGKYAAAVERHTAMFGRLAPDPTEPNTKGNPELSPAFEEWMMCLEPGRVTDPELWTHLSPRKAREVQLKMLGNGVVPPQALAAFRSLAVVMSTREQVAA